MTLIISCITKNNNILCCSDQRTIDENGKIINENKQKVFSFDQRCLIGFSGHEDISKDLLHYLCTQIFNNHKIWYPEIAFSESIKYRQQHGTEHYIEYFISGYTNNNEPILYYVVSSYLTFGLDITKDGYVLLGNHNVKFQYDSNLNDDELLGIMHNTITNASIIMHDINNNILTRNLFYRNIILP